MPIRRIFNISEKLKKASEAHAGQSEELYEIYMGINKRRRQMCNLVYMMEREERTRKPTFLEAERRRRGAMSNLESLWKGLECDKV